MFALCPLPIWFYPAFEESDRMNWHDLGTLILLLSPGLLLSAIVMGIFAAGG